MHIPEPLKKYSQFIQTNTRPSIRLELVDNHEFQGSRIGGVPLWPDGLEWPSLDDGTPLSFFAQLNLGELPSLSNWPDRGLLQFFLLQDEMAGMDLDSPVGSGKHRVVYHSNIPQPQHSTHLSVAGDSTFPLFLAPNYQRGMVGRLEEQAIPKCDYRVYPLGLSREEAKAWRTAFPSRGHRFGGYPAFSQYDPRHHRPEGDWELMFQVDSETSFLWGLGGVANWFIRTDALFRRDFSEILYQWDCP